MGEREREREKGQREVAACGRDVLERGKAHRGKRCAQTAKPILQPRVQERPEDVPTGELPRSISLLVDRHLVGKAAPGTRVKAIGIHTTLAVLPSLAA